MSYRSLKIAGLTATVAAAALLLTACGGQPAGGSDVSTDGAGTSGAVVADGSSTVAPLTEAAATGSGTRPGVNVTVATSGTGGGFNKFCAGETDISDASRPIKDEETAECEKAGVEFTEIIIANDGLSVVVNPENDWAQCLTVEQLNKIWAPEAEGKVTNWNQVDPSFPDVALALFGAGTDSGTFDYFTDAINGEEGAIRTDYSPSEDDNITVQGVPGDEGGIGFFGLSYVEENADSVKAVQVDSGAGCVTPSEETVQDGTYTPLGRPLFIYVNKRVLRQAPGEGVRRLLRGERRRYRRGRPVRPLTDEQKATAQDELATLG